MMKVLMIKGVPAAIRNDAWWLDGPIIEAIAAPQQRVVSHPERGSKR
jgi:hypothetical protein